jgi:hypothetical protein
MFSNWKALTKDEIRSAFGDAVPAILTTKALAQVIGVSPKTIYEWVAQGRFNGAFRKRGKRNLFWRDRAIFQAFNGPDWTP